MFCFNNLASNQQEILELIDAKKADSSVSVDGRIKTIVDTYNSMNMGKYITGHREIKSGLESIGYTP